MEFRSLDILFSTFAAIWLTESEFTAAECEPPMPIQNKLNAMCGLPMWLKVSSAQRLFGWNGDQEFDERYASHRIAGYKVRDKWDILLLQTTERGDDPNVGRTPFDDITESAPNKEGYIAKYSAEWKARGFKVDYGNLHFGGTASPSQAMPSLTPFYIEFEESMGMINMGGGNGQLDLVSMQIDWAQ